jgi:hypothetical protein
LGGFVGEKACEWISNEKRPKDRWPGIEVRSEFPGHWPTYRY